ncbi:hypothetical protein ACFLZN_01335 [Nanoarchaeota archaeon]
MRKVIFILIALLVLISTCYADIITPDEKPVDYCFEISNLDEFPEYVFLVDYSINEYSILTGECVSFYKLDTATIYAIEDSKFDESDFLIDELLPDCIGLTGEEMRECYNRQADLLEKGRLLEEEYFKTNPDLIKSDLTFYPATTVDLLDPTNSVKDVFSITSIGDKLEIKKVKVIYEFDDWTSQEIEYVTDDRPEVWGSTKVVKSPLWIFLIAFVAGVVIAIVLVVRSVKSKPRSKRRKSHTRSRND